MNRPGTSLDTFTLHTEDGDVHAEIRLVTADDSSETLWHYENDRHVLTHPAKRCNNCANVITSSHVGGQCYECAQAEGRGLHLD